MPDVPPVPNARRLTDDVERVFDAADGPLAAALEGFEPRPGQRALARAIANTLADGGVLLAEAGTGIGKTLAYLVPAALSGRRVLISTGTRNLQDQIVDKDVPTLARTLGRAINAVDMKGRTNYLCLHRMHALEAASGSLGWGDRQWFDRIKDWAAETTTGDRAEIDGLPDDLPFWRELTATSDQCLGRECPEYAPCFITKMRAMAAEAELVVVNHHLLCADASVRQGDFGEVIPECDLLVVDEAHQLEEVVTQYFGLTIGQHRLDELVRDTMQAVGAAHALEGALGQPIREAVGDVELAGRQLFDAVRMTLGGRSGLSTDRALLTTALIETLAPASERLDASLGAMAGALTRQKDASADLGLLADRAGNVREDLRRIFDAADMSFVRFIEARARAVAVRAAPIDASAIIRDVIVGDRHATVLTSATMAVDGRFDYVRERLGLTSAATLRVPSGFNYPEQALLYLPPHMPDPRDAGYNAAAADVITKILTRSRGRAFVLFTSYAAMRDVEARLDLPWPVLVQGSAPRGSLLRDFRATPHAVLLATSSFWQGVDVVGEALSAVVIDRLPFASPADPLVGARMAAVTARGGHAFQDYQVPMATLTLLQGLGRLIRSRSDRGVWAVLDPRLTRMAYGQRFLASLPRAPVTHDLDEVERFFDADETTLPTGF